MFEETAQNMRRIKALVSRLLPGRRCIIYKQEAKKETAQNMRRIKALVSRLNVRQTALQAGVSRESVYSLLRDGPLSHWPTYRKLTAFLAQWEDEHGKLT